MTSSQRLALGLIFLAASILKGQNGYNMKANSGEIEADFLFGYYQQDGDNAAVTGGIGTEQLTDISSMLVLNVPLDSIRSLSLMGGADYYASASTDNIDFRRSSASSSDVRGYGTLGYSQKNLARGETYGINAGFSAEYDYVSFSAGLSYAKELNEGNTELSLSAQAFLDRWELIYPIELRGRTSLPSAGRQSYNLQGAWSQVLGRRAQMSLSAELIWMRGLLSTPFHRVYFSDQATPDLERLPDSRLKIPIGLRLNLYPSDGLIVRSYYRYYWDDFGIVAHTAELELPIKLNDTWTLGPFYRYHTQSAADYFAAYAQHSSSAAFYTSDYDLAALSSHKYGFGLKYAPPFGLARVRLPDVLRKNMFMVKSLYFRGLYYQREPSLQAFLFSLGLSLGIK